MRTKLCVGLLLAVSVFSLICAGGISWAADKYPSRPIQITCGFPAGGASDFTNRIWAKYLEKYLGVPVAPINKPGAGGVLGVTYVANAAPDGYIMGNFSDHLGTAILLGQASYKLEDLRIVSAVGLVANTIVVHVDSPWKTFKDFVDHARKNPGVKYGHQGIGSSINIRMENLNKIAKLGLIGVPLKGDGEIMPAILGKHVPVGSMSAGAAKPLADAGKIRILFAFEPPADVGLDPTIPDFIGTFGKDVPDIDIPTYLVVPAKTPNDIVQILKQTMEKISKDPAFRKESMGVFQAVRLVDGETIMKGLPDKLARIKTIYKEVGMIK
jgi:tripartite-type tricarboxylate transporter receptor subunit TctC